MKENFIQASQNQFVVNGKPIILRGWALGSWMNFEHFMLGIPGTNSMIQQAFADVYGKENARVWLNSLLDQFVKEEDIRYLKEIGINSIRIPFGYHYFIDDRNPDVFLEEGFQILDRVVKLCEKNELYVILDLHSVPGSQNTDWHSDNITGQALFWQYRCFQGQIVDLWRELASRYADNPYIAGYDILNEPGFGLGRDVLNGFYSRVIAAIREVDENHILFLEGDDFGRNFEQLEEPDDLQIAYTVHFYPFVLEENVLDPQLDDMKRMKIFANIFNRQLETLKHRNRPIWCGESGYEVLAGLEEFYSLLLRHNINLCEDNNISWNLWTYKDAGRMGVAVPGKESDWMKMRSDIAKSWSHDWEQKVSMEVTQFIGETYYEPLSEQMLYELDFRTRSILHQIAVEQILKPKLRSISWEEMKAYPLDFAFENCEFRELIVRDIKALIEEKGGNGK